MPGTSAARFAGLALIIGAALSIIMIFLRPGNIAIDPLGPEATLLERVQVLSDQAALTHITAVLHPLGMLLMLFGFFTIRRAMDNRTARDAFIRLGIMLLTFGIFALAITHGLNHMIAHVVNHGLDRGRSITTLLTLAVDIQAVKAGISIIGGYGYLLGFASLALGVYLRFPMGVHKMLAFAIMVLALVGLTLVIIGDHVHDLLALYRITAYSNIVFTAWGLVLGIVLYRGHPGLKPAPSE